MLRSGREVPTVPTKKAPRTSHVVNRVRFSSNRWFDNEREVGFVGDSVEAFSAREKQALKRLMRRFKTVLDYCRYMDG